MKIPQDILDREAARAKECSNRVGSTCKLVTNEIGFTAGFGIDLCDQCWSAGGPSSDASRPVRLTIERRIVDDVKTIPVENVGVPIVKAMCRRHLPPAMAKRWVLQSCLRMFKSDSLDLASDVGGEALRAEVEAIWRSVKSPNDWPSVRESWKMASSLVSAVGSRLLGQVATQEEITFRKSQCFGDHQTRACPMVRRSKNGYSYCAACGCGDKKLAALDEGKFPKLHYKNLKCPLGKF